MFSFYKLSVSLFKFNYKNVNFVQLLIKNKSFEQLLSMENFEENQQTQESMIFCSIIN